MTRFWVTHRTSYRYSHEVTSCQSIVHLLPRDTATQRVLSSALTTDPFADAQHFVDAYGNNATRLIVQHPHEAWELTLTAEVETEPRLEPTNDVRWGETARQAPAEAPEVVEMLLASPFVPLSDAVRQFAYEIADTSDGTLEVVRALNARLYTEFVFDPAATEISTPVDVVLRERRGVCQDFAHLAIAVLRSLGVPTRYVSGYLETDPPVGAPKLVGADASHAWISVWVPSIGWVDADPTNGSFPSDRHLTVAWGRDYADVAPTRGVVFGPPTTQQLDVSVDVARLTP